MKLLIFSLTLFLSLNSFASSVYMSGNPTQVKQALEAEFGIGSGVGSRDGSCTLCHASSSGGPGNIQTTGFGRDFQDAAIRLGISGNGGNSLNATGANSLQSIFAEATFRAQDADTDGTDNEREFELNSDPNDSFVAPVSSGGSGGGGCGMITPVGRKNFPGSGLIVLLLPFLVLFYPKKLSNQKV